MPKISQYTAVSTPADADTMLVVQGGVTKKVTLSALKTYMTSETGVPHNFAGTTAPGVDDDESEGYRVGSVWIDIVSSPHEAYRCVDATDGSAVWLNTTLEIGDLGSGAIRTIDAAVADSDFLVGQASPVAWIKKTLAETLAILGIGDKADKVATSPAPTGYVAEFDSGGNLAVSTKLSSLIHASGSDNQDLSGLATKAETSPDPTGYLAEFDVTGNITVSSAKTTDIADVTTKADKVATSPDPTGYLAEFDATGNLVVSAKQTTDIVDASAKMDKIATSPNPDGYLAEFDATGAVVMSAKQTTDIADVTTKADKVATSPDPTDYVATFDSAGNLAVSDKTTSMIGDVTTKADKVATSPDPTGYLAELDGSGNLVKSSVLTTSLATITAGVLEVGTDDTVAGEIKIYGGPTGSPDQGGMLKLYNSVDEDDTEDYWGFEADGTNLLLGIAGNTDVFTFSSGGNFHAAGNIYGATYGSDASVSDTELKYISTLSSNAQDQLDSKLTIPTPGAANDFMVSAGSPLAYAKKTLSETQAILRAGWTPEIDCSADLSPDAVQCQGAIFNNYGQPASPAGVTIQLPTAAAGMNIIAIMGTAQAAGTWKLKADTNDKIYLDGVAGTDNQSVIVTPAVGDYITLATFRTGESTWDWIARTGHGTWTAGA